MANKQSNGFLFKLIFGTSLATTLGGKYKIYSRYFYSKHNLSYLKKKISEASKNNPQLIPIKILNQIKESGTDFQIKFIESVNQNINFSQNDQPDPFEKPYNKKLFLDRIGPDHNLFLNKFPLIQNHVIISTILFQKQESENTSEDLYQMYRILSVFDGFGFFNSCPAGKIIQNLIQAGSSVRHKHFQILPNEALKESMIISKITEGIQKKTKVTTYPENYYFDQKTALNVKIINPLSEYFYSKYRNKQKNYSNLCIRKQQEVREDSIKGFRYKLFIFKNINHSIRPIINQDKQYIYDIYIQLLKDIIKKDVLSYDIVINLKYNLIMTTKFLMIVERQKEKFRDQISLNGVAFTGSIIVKNEEQLKLLKQVKIIEVLEDICEPSNQGSEPDSKILFI